MIPFTLHNTTKRPLLFQTEQFTVRLEPMTQCTVGLPPDRQTECTIRPVKAWKFRLVRHSVFSFLEDLFLDNLFGLAAILLNKPPLELVQTSTYRLFPDRSTVCQIVLQKSEELAVDEFADVYEPAIPGIAAADVRLPEWAVIRNKLKARLIAKETIRCAVSLAFFIWLCRSLIGAILVTVIAIPVCFFGIRRSLRFFRCLKARFDT